MKAVILAGGQGSRLRPLTCCAPKPMAMIAGKPAIMHIIEQLAAAGVTEIAVTLMYLPNEIRNYIENAKSDVKIRFYEEEKPLGTAGGVLNCRDFLDESFIVISGDCANSIELDKAMAFHRKSKADATIILKNSQEPYEYGVVLTGADGRVSGFIEKPPISRVYSDKVNTGIYILEPQVLGLIPENTFFDFAHDLYPKMLAGGKRLYSCLSNHFWCDIGSLETYLQTNISALEGTYKCVIPAPQVSQGIYSNSDLGSCKIIPPVYIGSNVSLEEGAIIGPFAVIGDNTVVRGGAGVKKSVVGEGCLIESFAELRGAIVLNDCVIKKGARLFEGSCIGNGSTIGQDVTIDRGVKVWPKKTVGDGLNVTENIIWGVFKPTLFDDAGISGENNVEISSEKAARLGRVLGFIAKNLPVAIASNNDRFASGIALALLSGISSMGSKAVYCGGCSPAVLRFMGNELSAAFCAHITSNTELTTITIYEKNGAPLTRETERKINSLFFKDDVHTDSVSAGEILTIKCADELFFSRLIKECAFELKGQTAAINCSDSALQKKTEQALKTLGCGIAEGNISVFIEPDGESFSLLDEKGDYCNSELSKIMLTICLCETAKHGFELPQGYPTAAKKIASAYGKVTKLQKYDFMDGLRFISAPFAVMEILKYLEIKCCPLSALTKRLPKYYSSTKTVEVEKSKVDIMNKLCGSEYEKELGEGVVLNIKENSVLVMPSRTAKSFFIKAEASSAEIADELCEEISKFILE